MATNASITFNWGSLPPGYEPTDANDFVSQLAKIVTGYLSGSYTAINFGSTTPAAEDQDKPWFRTTATGEFDRVYTYSSTYGKWVCPHPTPYDDNERRLWVGTPTQLLSYDGGDGTSATPTETAGAMWAVDSEFAAKFPVGVGSFSNAGAVAVKGSTTDSSVSGIDRKTLSESEIPAHNHFVVNSSTADNTSSIPSLTPEDSISMKTDEGPIDSNMEYSLTGRDRTTYAANVGKTSDYGSGDPFYVLPPFYGTYFIKRTARRYYTVT